MSSSGYRGRSFGPRGARTNGPANGFNGPRFPHPSFNHPRLPHRLPGPDKWIERSNFVPWQQNKNFLPHPYRGSLQFRPNNRGRIAGSRGIIRFSGPGRPSAPQFCLSFIRNPIHRVPLPQEEQVEDKCILIPQTPLPGSEEERQQKISETADKLKQKLSSITEEELTNFWEDDLSVLPNNGSEEENIRNKGIPELRHEPPELDLTFTDFRDIGRVDCNNSKFENADNKSNDDISISFEQKSTDNVINISDEITIIDDNKEESLTILDSTYDKNNFNPTLGDNKCPEQIHSELSDFECNIEDLQLQDNNITKSLTSDLSDTNEKLPTLNLDGNKTNLLPIDSVNDSLSEKSSNINDIEITSMLVSTTNIKGGSKIDFLQNQNIEQTDIQDANRDITQDSNVNVQHDNYTEIKLLEDNQIQNNLQTNISEKIVYQNVESISDSSQNKSFNFSFSNEEIHSNITHDSISPTYSNYNEVHKLNDDRKLNNPSVFQTRIFNIPPRFTSRNGGPRCHWTFQQTGKNVFFRGPQRLPLHGNQISPSRHTVSFKTTDLVPVGFDPRAPPPFIHNVPASCHDCQHNATVPFSSNDLPPAFDPSEPPPNIRSKSVTEPSNRQESLKSVLCSGLRSQAINTPQSNLKIVQPSPAFDPREPPPRISNVSVTTSEKVPEFNPQQPPPKIHKREETLQPPPIFDPRLSSQERSNLITPLDTTRPNIMSLNLMETSPVSDFNIGSVTSNFPQLPPINIASHTTFISNVQMNFQSVISQTNSGQGIMREFPMPPPPTSITKVPPPLPKESLVGGHSNPNQSLNMDDGLEDMQEAMEFAKQIMNMTEEIKNENTSSVFSELSMIPSEIPVPNENICHSLSVEDGFTSTAKKYRKKESKNKKNKQNVICGPELINERQKDIEIRNEEQGVQNQSKNIEDILLTNDQIRPKVVFNLNSKTKKIHKPEEWHRIPINISENRESLQGTIHNSNKEKIHSRKHFSENRKSNTNQNKNQEETKIKKNSTHSTLISNISSYEKSNDTSYNYKKYTSELEKVDAQSSNTVISNNMSTQKNKKSKKEFRKEEVPTSESSWKNRVISRFLKMSKNDICNMVNNSSLRKFDIAMKHLVKERRSSLSLELRTTEDEKMKEYDREEFMNQLNAMLDPSAVVGITDLPTKFIHHLSEVLQLDSMPLDNELSESQNVDINDVQIISQNETSRLHICEDATEENLRVQSSTEYPKLQNVCEECIEDTFLYNKEEPNHFQNTELNLNVSREDIDSSHRSLSNKLNPEVESTHKKQQPLFNEADLDDILSEVTEKTKNLPNTVLTLDSGKSFETRTDASLMQTVTEAFEYNSFSQIPNKTVADLDDIFSAGIARVKHLGKSNADLDNSRIRKSSSEDRNTFRSERYERWNRKEREDPDAFRNLTKEEWEAKYGSISTTITSTIARESASNSAENLSKDDRNNCAQRYCSSDSPMRHLSISPLTCEAPTHNLNVCIGDPNEIEGLRRVERSESSSESSSSSYSDSDEETVAPNVTKLLKVIKEKEKIAKKKSLNETIRDEVAAEIEKKWKEKSKHKERKSRKREKRKKDKKEKRRKEKKEKKKKRKHNSCSDSSKSDEQIEGFRLLTENEIKKEVIVKEEPVSSFEENIILNNETSLVKKIADSQIESQNLQIEKERGLVTYDTGSKNKSEKIVSMIMQPKTKAQLKQMPESKNTKQKQVTEKAIGLTKDTTANTDNEKMKNLLEMNKDYEITKNSNERMDTISSTNISLHETHVSLTVREPSSSIQSHTETISDNSTTHTSFTCSISNPVADVDLGNQCIDKKIYTNISPTENKSSYKKIDIKAYKERALQRRLKEQGMLKESVINSTSLIQESYHTTPVNKSNTESLNTMNEVKTTEINANKIQIKDPRLIKTAATSNITIEDSNKDIERENSLEGEHQSMDIVHTNKESLISVYLNNSNEKKIQPVDSDLHTLKDNVKFKEGQIDNKSSSQLINTQEFDEFRRREKLKLGSGEEMSKKSISTIDSSKFKNIRSEGSKELKLKKEKVKKSVEKRKKRSKSNESKSSTEENFVEKQLHKKLSNHKQELLITSSNTTDQIKVEKIGSRDIDKNLCKLQTVETFSKNIDSIVENETAQEQINIHSVKKQNDEESVDDNRKSVDTNKKVALQINEVIIENQHIGKETEKIKDEHSLITTESEKNSEKEIEKHITKANKEILSELIPVESLNKQKDISSNISLIGTTSLDHVQSIFTEKCMKNTTVRVSDYGSEESHSFSERIDVDIEENGHSINIKCLKNVKTHDNSTLDMNLISKATIENDNTNVKVNDVKNQDESTFQLHEKLETSDDCNNAVKSGSKSPNSSNSPFKGFLVDTTENDVCQLPQLYHTKVNNESDKGSAMKNPNQCLETCFNDKSITEFAEKDKDNDKESPNKLEENNEITSTCNLVKEQHTVRNKTINNNLNTTDDTKIDVTISETGNRNITKENDPTYNLFPEQKKVLSVNDMNNHDTVDEDSEPFIVLDKYIDDVDGKSIKKLSTPDIDLEECIARDADLFTTKSLQKEQNSTSAVKSPNFNSIIFNELSQVFDKNNLDKEQKRNIITTTHEKEESTLSRGNTIFPTELLPSEKNTTNTTEIISSTSELNLESNSKISETTKSTKSNISESPVECTQGIKSTSNDISKRSLTPELFITDTIIEKKNHYCTDISENNSQHNLESPNMTKIITTSLENEISPNLSVPVKTGTKTSIEDFLIAASISETNSTFSKLKKCQELDSFSDKQALVPSEIRTTNDKDVSIDPITEHEISKHLNKTPLKKLNKGGKNEILNNTKNKLKMKHKKQKRNISETMVKEIVKSDTVKVKYPTTKEAVMARMIEIDVEIHKLMTEKMTLYQMLTNDTLPGDNNLQKNNVMHENEEVETSLIRPRTPSVLMSQLIQNIETSPVSNPCPKTTTECLSVQDSPSNSIQTNKFKTLYKQNHHVGRKRNCTSICSSDDEEMHHPGDIKLTDSRKRKKQRTEKVIQKLENKLDGNITTKDTQNTVTEKKQVNDAIKLPCKNVNMRKATTEQESDQFLVNETKSQEDTNKTSIQEIDSLNNDKIETFKDQEVQKIIEPTESEIYVNKIVQTKIPEFNEENYITKNNGEDIETLNKRNNRLGSPEKLPESRASERSSIYSDDSTWDSILQNSSIDEQKKSNTGLALLEETYKKEMAKTRKIKAEARKEKKKKLQNLLEAVNILTADEEELPLSTLYIKKLHQKQMLLNSLEQQMKQEANEDPQHWKNVVEVINAVAENKTNELYPDSLEKQLIGGSESATFDKINLVEDSGPKENKEKQVVGSSTLKNIKEVCPELLTDVNISCEDKDKSNNNSEKDELLSGKLQKFLNNEFQRDLEINVSSKTVKDLPKTYVHDTFMNVKKNLVEFPVQKIIENDNIVIDQLTAIENSDSSLTESNSNNVHNDRNILNISENPDTEKTEGQSDMKSKESNLQDNLNLVNIEKNIATCKPTNSQLILTEDVLKSEDVGKNCDASIQSSNGKNTEIPSEIIPKTESESKLDNINEKKLQDSSVLYDKDNNVDNVTSEVNFMTENNHFISLKEHKRSCKRKEVDQFNKISSEENNNQNCASVSSVENIGTSKSDETLGRKPAKRKRGNSKTPLRRSSRYTEEPAKRIKLEADVTASNTEQEVQEKNFSIQLPSMVSTSVSPCAEVETILINPRISRDIQKPLINKKRCTPVFPEIEILADELNSNNESLKGIKRHKKHTMFEMMNCVVRVVDCKHTILNATANIDTLKKYRISTVNKPTCPNSTEIDSFVSSTQSASTKDLSTVCIKQTTSLTELPQNQTPKLINKFEDTTQPSSDQINPVKIKRILKSAKMDSSVNDKEFTDPDVEVMPVLIKEPVNVDIRQNCDKPDIEIVEEKMIVTKNQQHTNSGSTLTVIDTKDDKELPRTQYTVHKGPILDIKVFENSFLAASEDGRIYRYNQASNGILNIYKGHKAAVTCLYVYNLNNTDVSKEWMFSGSLDGSLRCYNIMTGVQVRDTADIGSPIQCMDEAWGMIFIGTKSGHVSRYHMKSGVIKGNSIQFSEKSVLALKATNEGPRRVLIVASRSQPITIRDAQSGLFLRTICGQKSHTVYSLMRDNNLIYCGTSSTSIPVFDFTNGEQTMQYDAGVGIVCMRLYKQLLFAGCYDGNIYVFDTKDHRLVCSIPGPGNMLLSMDVVDNKIIAGSKDKRLQSWQMPREVRSLL
ncbi:PREDICTED: uncharacterized protein LOC108548808 [Eufriesea mexicana]|uniref:uncharacterized protein LOC108548808 n=1 Tax=Eufriesea mexicana TaxID=516756 RepID=UPI00083C18CD|nr:PREDICTED: uncharacterized protein LOC108548808 [Eufriesea mexicana]